MIKEQNITFLRDDSEEYVVNGICEKMNQKPLILLGGGGHSKLDIAADPRHIARHDDEKEGEKLILPYQSHMSLVSERKEDNREIQRSLHIIMPMAGEESWFLKEGRTTPKPKI